MSKEKRPCREDYIFASSRIRLLEKALISQTQWDSLTSAESKEDFFRLLRDTPYGREHREGEKTLSKLIEEDRRALFQELGEMVPDKRLLRLLELPDLAQGLKVLYKESFLGQPMDHLLVPVHGVEWPLVEHLLENPQLLETPGDPENSEPVTAQNWGHFTEQVLQSLTKAQNLSLFEAELLIDQAVMKETCRLAQSLEAESLIGWICGQVDWINLETLVRIQPLSPDLLTNRENVFLKGGLLKSDLYLDYWVNRKELLPVGTLQSAGLPEDLIQAWKKVIESGDLVDFENRREHWNLEEAQSASRVNYGPEVLYGYVWQKQVEWTNLRVLLALIESHASREEKNKALRRPQANRLW